VIPCLPGLRPTRAAFGPHSREGILTIGCSPLKWRGNSGCVSPEKMIAGFF
jgi:hypothetical protein